MIRVGISISKLLVLVVATDLVEKKRAMEGSLLRNQNEIVCPVFWCSNHSGILANPGKQNMVCPASCRSC